MWLDLRTGTLPYITLVPIGLHSEATTLLELLAHSTFENHLVNKYLLSSNNVPGSVLCPQGVYI